jgi:hypothetical protein
MRRESQRLMLCLVLAVSSAAYGRFTFTAWSDNHVTNDTYRARFQWVAGQIDEILGSDPPDFHISGGDVENGGHALVDADLAAFCPSCTSWSYVASNHDTSMWGLSNDAFDYDGNTRIILLNLYSCPAGVCTCDAGRVCEHTLAWLATQLDGSHPFVFVVGHEPAYPDTRHVGDSLDQYPDERDAFWQLLNERGVVAYLCGHTHYYDVYSNSVGSTCQINLGNAGNDSGDSSNPQTFVLFDITDDGYVEVTPYSGFAGESFTPGSSFLLYPPTPVYQAHAPSPKNDAENVPVNTVLSWVSGTGAVSHDVWFGTVASGLVLVQNQTTTTYAPALDFDTSYVWRIDEHYSDKPTVPGVQWTFTTGPAAVGVQATGETSVDGDVTGSYLDTHASDGSSETITEVLNVPNKNGYSTLEHIWTFDVPTGSFVEFHVEAYQSVSTDGDSFDFSYSTDGLTYHYMLTVTETYGTEQSFTLPSATAGPVYIKATDTDHTRKSQDFDTLFVDCMWITSSQVPMPDYKARNPSPTDGETSVPTTTVLAWEAGEEAIAHDVYLGVDPLSLPRVSESQADTSYTPGDLSQGTVYYWRIDEIRADGVETGTIWSFTTYADPGTPTTMSVAVATSTLRLNPPNEYGRAIVTVTDNLGDPVPGATVAGHFTGDFSDACEDQTDQNGQIEFVTSLDAKKPSFGFEVDSVVHPGLTWLQ